MTRRRDVPVLAFTVREAADALRLSEHTLRIWIKEGIVRTVQWNTHIFVPRVELDRLIDDAMRNGGTLPALASATTSPSHGPATVVEGDVIGVAGSGPHATGSSLGEVRAATTAAPAGQPSGSSAPTRHSNPQAATAGPSGKKSRPSPLAKEA